MKASAVEVHANALLPTVYLHAALMSMRDEGADRRSTRRGIGAFPFPDRAHHPLGHGRGPRAARTADGGVGRRAGAGGRRRMNPPRVSSYYALVEGSSDALAFRRVIPFAVEDLAE